MSWLKICFVAALASLLPKFSDADFGGYVDPTFNCPATTTCPQVCVANATDCPPQMQCNGTDVLCADGSCAQQCDPSLSSPCAFQCAPVACQLAITTYDLCTELFGPYYDNETACGALETESSTPIISIKGPAFVVHYAWYSTVTFLIVAWCAFNNRFSPVPGSTQILLSDPFDESTTKLLSWQTFYKIHPVGVVLEAMTLISLVEFHALLGWLCIQYYILNGGSVSHREAFHLRIPNEPQLLRIFIWFWNFGILWTFWLKFPHSIHSLFLRRCIPSQATHVAVYVTKEVSELGAVYDPTYLNFMRRVLSFVVDMFTAVLRFIFSEVDQRQGGVYKFCRVRSDGDIRYFVFSFRRYIYSADEAKFIPGVWPVGPTLKSLVALRGGLSSDDAYTRRSIVGPNKVEMSKPYFLKVVFTELSKPFYTYQAFMMWVWVPLYYYYMAVTWSIVMTSGAIIVSFFNYRNLKELYRVTHCDGYAEVLRDGQFITVPQTDIVPGDIVKVATGTVYADILLFECESALVDESALTGESSPMAKTAVDPANIGDHLYDRKVHKRHTLSAGTTVTECDGTLGVALFTGSYTARGELLRDIISFQRHQFKFDAEVGIVLFILILYTIFTFNMNLYLLDNQAVYGWFYGMYIVFTVLPPLLPTVFTVSVGVSADRLSRNRITCTSMESILVAGKVTRAFFDKTGTLTRQGLDFIGSRSARSWDILAQTPSQEMSLGMATCHGLTRSQAGQLIGNPVDRTMFEASGAIINNEAGPITDITDSTGKTATIVKHFDFDHHRMTQSVIVRTPEGSLVAFVKGSAESIKKLCGKETLPSNFDDIVRGSAQEGTYQISMASKVVMSDAANWDASSVKRDDIEGGLAFIGVIDFSNLIREDTAEVIRHLAQGEVKSFMVTGDSVLTGIRIAREAGIMQAESPVLIGVLEEATDEVVWTNESHQVVDTPNLGYILKTGSELAITGEAWASLRVKDVKLATHLAEYIRVYGRCTPYDKVSVVKAFIELGYVTLCCGDGGNDVGALKAAHVGIALSDSDASIVAPFTSLDKTITSVIDILREGRCALASSISSYKYIIMYGQVETVTQLINAYFSVTYAEWCWTFMDGVWTITCAFAIPLSRPADRLSPTRPTASILGPQTLASVIGVWFLNISFIVLGIFLLFQQDWFQCRKWNSNDVSNVTIIGDNYESEVAFLIAAYPYIVNAVIYSFGYEFRQAWYRNYVLVVLFLANTFVLFYITLVPGNMSCIWRVNCTNDHVRRQVSSRGLLPIQNPFNTTVMPLEFRRIVAVLMACNAIAIASYEYFVVNGIRRYYAAKRRQAVANTKGEFDNYEVAVGTAPMEGVAEGPTKVAVTVGTKSSTDDPEIVVVPQADATPQ